MEERVFGRLEAMRGKGANRGSQREGGTKRESTSWGDWHGAKSKSGGAGERERERERERDGEYA
jgi:hypothetical protein